MKIRNVKSLREMNSIEKEEYFTKMGWYENPPLKGWSAEQKDTFHKELKLTRILAELDSEEKMNTRWFKFKEWFESYEYKRKWVLPTLMVTGFGLLLLFARFPDIFWYSLGIAWALSMICVFGWCFIYYSFLGGKKKDEEYFKKRHKEIERRLKL